MRETKDQTIIRLKREVAELKEAVRGQKRMAKEKIKESKETLIQSQSKSKADLRGQINKYKSETRLFPQRLYRKYILTKREVEYELQSTSQISFFNQKRLDKRPQRTCVF
jgi:hypothetical protein